jgi:phospholipase C
MVSKNSAAKLLNGARIIPAFIALAQSFFGPLVEGVKAADNRPSTPIKHVIVIVGENRTFDHIFATYQPKPGERVNNLLSEGIINADGTPGPNYAQAHQYSADITGSPVYQLSPTTGKRFSRCCPRPSTADRQMLAQATASAIMAMRDLPKTGCLPLRLTTTDFC